MTKKKSKRNVRFKEAVQAISGEVGKGYGKGIERLATSDKKLISCNTPQRLTGSLNLDKALERDKRHANKNRWDYAIGYKSPQETERAIWIEIHTISEKEVSTLIKKHDWLKDWLNSDGESLKKITTKQNSTYSYFWLSGRGVRISRSSSSFRRLSKRGIQLAKKTSS